MKLRCKGYATWIGSTDKCIHDAIYMQSRYNLDETHLICNSDVIQIQFGCNLDAI